MAIGEVLHEYGILSIVDSVAGLFGEPMNMDVCKIDILCGGSQKALSAPPGLAMVWVSPEAFKGYGDAKAQLQAITPTSCALKRL